MTELLENSCYCLNTKDVKADKRISFYVIYYFIASALNATIKHAFVISGGWYSAVSAIIGSSIVFFMLIPIREVWRRSGKLLLGTIGVFVVIYLIGICLVLSRGESLSMLLRYSVFLTFAWWIPVGVYACSVKDKRVLYRTCLKGSFVISLLMVLLWFSRNSKLEDAEYSMFMGFALILPLLFHINELYKTHRFFYLLLSLFEFFMILAFANRGVLLSLVAFVIFKIVFETGSSLKKTIAITLTTIAGVLLVLFNEQIIVFLIDVFASIGVVSRTLNLALADKIADASGRVGIWQICKDMIYEKPVFGWGLGGEFLEIAHRMGAAPEDIGPGFSPHNGLIQNFVNFGIIGGLIASLIVIIPLFSIRRIRDAYANHLVAIFFCASIMPCFVSADGFFTKPAVAVVLFLFYHRNKFNKQDRIDEYNY